MLKLTYGIPEENVPSKFCDNFSYIPNEISYDTGKIEFSLNDRGCMLEFPIDGDEEIYGFGLQLKGFNHKGRKLTLRVNSDPVAYTGDTHAPVPFFVTTKGYGMYIDTLRTIDVYCGFHKKQKRQTNITAKNDVINNFDELYLDRSEKEATVMTIDIPGAKGIDVYIIEGKNITEIVSRYNMLAGGGCDVPEWGFGAAYRAYANYTDNDVRELADYFKNNGIKITTIGLEPGWQTKSYSCSYVWDKERFPKYKEMIEYLKSNGFHINLWEHAFVDCTSPIYDELFDLSGNYEVWKGLVPDFSLDASREIFAKYHKEYLTEIGIDGFKLDECDSSDFVNSDWSFPNCAKFPGGLDGEQYHAIFGTLYMKTILQSLDGVKTLSNVRNAGALASGYPFVLYSDLYDHGDFIRGNVNSGFCGLLWTPEVRDAKNKKDFLRRLQTNVFSVQCLINAWYLDKAPWLEYGLEEEVKQLLIEREKLVPMLTEAFDEYKTSGKPPVRALVCDYTEDKETYAIDDEYIFCGRLLVAPLTEKSDTREVYLPFGKWRDYWTKEPVECGWFSVETENIPVYEKL